MPRRVGGSDNDVGPVRAALSATDHLRLVSADADLTAPIVAIRNLFPSKSIIVAFPPTRKSYELQKVATGHYFIGEEKFVNSLLPEKVVLSNGFVLQRPEKWK